MNSLRLLLPNRSRATCGMMSPMKPMEPQNDTTTEIKTDEVMSTMLVVFCVSMPNVCAVSVPTCMMFKDLE